MEDNWKKYVVKHNDRNIREVLGDMIGNNKKLQKGYSTVRIKEAWKSEMGDIICSYTQKIFYKEGLRMLPLPRHYFGCDCKSCRNILC